MFKSVMENTLHEMEHNLPLVEPILNIPSDTYLNMMDAFGHFKYCVFESFRSAIFLFPATESPLTNHISKSHENDMLQDILIPASEMNIENVDIQAFSENDVSTLLFVPPLELVTLSRSDSSVLFSYVSCQYCYCSEYLRHFTARCTFLQSVFSGS